MKDDVELSVWLQQVTGEDNVEKAKEQVRLALNIQRAQPHIGVLAVLVGPGGALGVATTQNLLADMDGVENMELALMDVQREVLNLRRQQKRATVEQAVAGDVAQPPKIETLEE